MKPLLPAALALALLAAPATAQARDWDKGAPLTITMTDHGFAPARIVMKQGAGYILRLRNVSTRTHSFAAKPFFRLALIDPRDQAWVARDEVEVAPGRTATIRLVAPDTPNARFDYRSTRIADAAEKFKGRILVR